MASVTVDVSLEDFDLDALLEEVEDRYSYDMDKQEIEDWAKDLLKINLKNVKQYQMNLLLSLQSG